MLRLYFDHPNRFGPSRSTVMSKHGMVVTSQPLAAMAGVEILRAGGNAIDAAIATAAMLNVVEPMSTGVGGDAFAIIYLAKSGKILGLNASGRSAYAATLKEYEQRLGANAKDIPNNSMLAVTVPGTVDGWASAVERCGRMSLRDVLAPAIRTAEEGFPVAPQTAIAWREWQASLAQCADSVRTWLSSPAGAPRPGETFNCLSLAKTLREIAEGGPDAFYRGPIAERIVEFSEANGGLLSRADFAAHSSTWVEPISINYRSYDILELPPNGQGIAVLEGLQILANDDLGMLQHNSARAIHLQIEAIKCALRDSKRCVTDPEFSAYEVEELFSPDYTEARRLEISDDRTIKQVEQAAAKNGDTVYLCVADDEGNVVSFINSIFFPWGTGLTAGDTGIVLQNRGASFSLDPLHANRLEPHKRSRHTIMPAMMFEKAKPLMAFGFVGGDVQPQGQLQFLNNVIDFGMNLQDALDAPRWRYETMDGSVGLEVAIAEETSKALKYRGHTIAGSKGFFGGGQALLVHPEYGTFQGASDSRRDGCAIGF
jgi:gamma-glutamyltranspeptidase / glutathione hydrolase